MDGVNSYLHHLLFHHQFLSLNKDIQIDNKCFIFSHFSKNRINFVRQIFHSDGKLHCWEFLKKYLLSQNMKFKWFQLMHSLPREWKEAIQTRSQKKPISGEVIWSFFPIQCSWWVRGNWTDLKKAFSSIISLLHCS